MTVFVVRHADAGDRHRWTGPDELRPLTPEGMRQASALVKLLADARLVRLLSSPTVRCRQTLEPLARAPGLPIEDDERLLEGRNPDEALTMLAGLADAAACTHGDIGSGIVERLARRGVPLDGGMQWGKGSVWAFEVEGGQIVRGRYLPPPQV